MMKLFGSIFTFLLAAMISAQAGDSISAGQRVFFETKIRPVLVEQCYECHSAKSEKLGGKLRLDSREAILTGGESGPAIVPGKPSESLLIQALHWENDLEMPPEEPLADQVVRDFFRWIEMGAPDPRTATPAIAKTGEKPEAEPLWSLQPVANLEIPAVRTTDWPRDLLDRFVLAGIEAAGLKPAADASPRELIRRMFVDLTGLPPNFDEVRAFEADFRENGETAAVALVDRLLASPHFGERWGRHWLDVARYGESNGNDGLSRNPTFPHAWRYRDYVIAAFNADTPFDRFVTEQIAGDLLPTDTPQERDSHLVATGFLALGSKPAKAMNNNFAMDVVADQLDVVGRGIMGLSVSCARCHDHKFDPIPTRDYYALAGIFTSTETMWGTAANEKLTAPATDLHVLQAAAKVPPPKGWVETVLVRESTTGKPKPVPKSKWAPGTPLAMGARDRKEPADCKINLKGDAKKLGKPVPRGFLSAIDGAQPEIPAGQSGRLELARWLTSGEHPLTARVFVNRVWQHLFGEGIVRTPDDFGVYGERPSHPELLDHLASRFVEDGWSVKRLIRAIVLSRTYQLSSLVTEEAIRADPENRLLARHNRRRMDAESLRDGMLAVSGQLNPKPAEGSLIRHRDILVNLAGNLHEPSRHRSIYLCYLRNAMPSELTAFDLPDFLSVTGQREVTTVPSQALYLFNHPFVVEQAGHLAASLPDGDISAAYQRALNRQPTAAEVNLARKLIAETGFAAFCQALLASNEFRYVD